MSHEDDFNIKWKKSHRSRSKLVKLIRNHLTHHCLNE